MADRSLSCYLIDTSPYPLIIPSECVADVVESPKLIGDSTQKASWMAGYVAWNSQEVPLLCFENLLSDEFVRPEGTAIVTVLQPIPKAARKAYGAILSFGQVEQLELPDDLEDVDFPEDVDRRYVQAAFSLNSKTYLIPKLSAMGVAFSYY